MRVELNVVESLAQVTDEDGFIGHRRNGWIIVATGSGFFPLVYRTLFIDSEDAYSKAGSLCGCVSNGYSCEFAGLNMTDWQ